MIIRCFTSFLLVFFSSVNVILSQKLKEISEYEFEKYAVEQGTAMNASLVVFEDTYGYIWLGSQSGVDRFDGYDFKNFANVSSDSSSTNLKWVNAIAEDGTGHIWATDQFGNVSNYKRSESKWVNYYPNYKDLLKSGHISFKKINSVYAKSQSKKFEIRISPPVLIKRSGSGISKFKVNFLKSSSLILKKLSLLLKILLAACIISDLPP